MPSKARNKTVFGIEKILRFLPHRYPFLLVDRVLSLDIGKSVTALKNVSYNEPFFQGHFPEFRVMPGVLTVEALAQTGGILLYHSIPEPETKLVLLSKINSARFRKPVIPGDQLKLEVKIIKLKNRFCHVRGTASVDDEVVTECEIIATVVSLEEMNEQK